MMVLDAMALAACEMPYSPGPQRSRGKEGADHGRGGRRRWALLPRDVRRMVAERQADLPVDDRLHAAPHDREPGPGRRPLGVLPPHGTARGGRRAPATARCHRA